jgi:hypothetical protein
MRDAGGGGAGTPWATMSIPDMRRVIQSANTEGQWEIAGGWQKSAELLLEHKYQVEDFRRNLAAVWPPSKSAAAQAYLARLDALLANLHETYEAALANHDALTTVTGSIHQAQARMEEIFKEYEQNQTLLTQFAATQQPSNGTPSPTPSPSGEQPPVAPGRQEQLRLQAVQMLSGVSTELAQAQIRIVRPPRYEAVSQRDESKSLRESGYVAPPIPPFGIASLDDGDAALHRSRPSASFPTSTVGMVNPPVAPTPPQPGLILGGANGFPSPPPSPPVAPLPTLPNGGSPITHPGLLPPATTALPGGVPTTLPPAMLGRGAPPPSGPIRTPFTPEGMRAVAPGGIIGGNPMVGVGQPATGRPGGQRVNPVGGVIGQNTATGVGGQGHRRRHDAEETPWDPDHPWETAEGVEPVVLPQREQRIDPGPAIGLP